MLASHRKTRSTISRFGHCVAARWRAGADSRGRAGTTISVRVSDTIGEEDSTTVPASWTSSWRASKFERAGSVSGKLGGEAGVGGHVGAPRARRAHTHALSQNPLRGLFDELKFGALPRCSRPLETGDARFAHKKCSDGTGVSASCAAPPSCSSNHLVHYVKVITSASYKPWFAYPGIPSTTTLNGQAVMRSEP